MLKQFSKDHILVLILVLVILASGGDLIADLSAGVNNAHLIQEAVIFCIAITSLIWISIGIRQQNRDIINLHQQLEEAKNLPKPDSAFIVETKRHLSEIITQQFSDWALTKSEQEVGQFLLKGLSLKEIATLRGTTEKTVRQQASTIYQKSGVSGRHAFSAWFIEDFL